MSCKFGADWPDWTGATAVIIGTGPSAPDPELPKAQGLARFVVVKGSWKLAPWADVLYGVDRDWWIANAGAPGFLGIKVSPSPTACKVFKLRQVRLKPRAEILVTEAGLLGCGLKSGGGHSGFQAMNLAVQLGATRLVLLGFDMTLDNGAHWHKEQNFAKPDAKRTESWRKELDGCAGQFVQLGVEVINSSMGSALQNFRKVPLLQALHGS